MSRPIGFIESWQPHAKTRELLSQVAHIIAEYQQFGPMTCRQVFYRLVGTFDYSKTENAYSSLCEVLQRARRARLISFDAIRDDGTVSKGGGGYSSFHQLLQAFESNVRYFRLRPDIGQPSRLIVQCEAAGMTEMLARMASPYGATVRSAGGFDSVTAKHELARSIAFESRPTVILHLGDFDPSGEHIFQNLEADVSAFIEGMGEDTDKAIFRRVAVTPEQIRGLGLPTAPAKSTDRRSFAGLDGDGTSTVQCEAISPPDLQDIVLAAIAEWWDEDAAQALKEREADERQELQTWWANRPGFDGGDE
ncbi:hypothetical protein [Ensifer sp. SSB1]|uniref:hypothetical protein n=1 Tax=Ensifer sp. SSB1 TaxID=2795385 RepID=UPI001A463DA7|nr:hypothetical protein [Ensifer sp. SSB1]MBK5567238.1 hypothetical protein [Ensifer sp. SSB1]